MLIDRDSFKLIMSSLKSRDLRQIRATCRTFRDYIETMPDLLAKALKPRRCIIFSKIQCAPYCKDELMFALEHEKMDMATAIYHTSRNPDLDGIYQLHFSYEILEWLSVNVPNHPIIESPRTIAENVRYMTDRVKYLKLLNVHPSYVSYPLTQNEMTLLM